MPRSALARPLLAFLPQGSRCAAIAPGLPPMLVR